MLLRGKDIIDLGSSPKNKNQHLQEKSDEFRFLLLLDRFLNHLVHHLYQESDKLGKKNDVQMCKLRSKPISSPSSIFNPPPENMYLHRIQERAISVHSNLFPISQALLFYLDDSTTRLFILVDSQPEKYFTKINCLIISLVS